MMAIVLIILSILIEPFQNNLERCIKLNNKGAVM